MIKKITKKIKESKDNGIFHDSRRDINTLAEYCNMLAEKINELIDAINGGNDNA